MKVESKSILFYSETEVFGGHELMTLMHIKKICEIDHRVKLAIVFNKKNIRFQEKLIDLQLEKHLSILPLDFRGVGLGAGLFLNYRLVKKLFSSLMPDRVVLVQGNPDSCVIGLLAAKRMRFPVLSYIPLPQRLAVTGGKLPVIRDYLVEKFVFPYIDIFITISESLKRCLVRRGVPASKVRVAKNSIRIRHCKEKDREEMRRTWSVPSGALVLLVVGRIQLAQKAQDILVRELEIFMRSCKTPFMCIIVGDGPDMEVLKSILTASEVDKYVKLIGWHENVEKLMCGADVLIIPSRYEGVPLVMLEALVAGKVVIGSDRDGMRDYLPDEWRFDPEEAGALAERLAKIDIARERDHMERLRAQVLPATDGKGCAMEFYKAIQNAVAFT